MFCDDLEGWDGRRDGGSRGRVYIYIYICVCVCVCVYIYIYIIMTHSCFVWQKPAQHCKAIILQLKKRKGLPKNFKESETKIIGRTDAEALILWPPDGKS